MNVLITGGAGFIGSHLAQSLCEQGFSVTVIDNLSQGSIENLGWREPKHSLAFVHADVTDLVALRPHVLNSQWVFHLAAEASVPFSVSHPLEAHLTNLDSTFRLLLLCKESKITRFVFASSSAVYGDAGENPVDEEHRIAPLSPYGLQKYAGESYARMFWSLYQLPAVALRFFNVYGPRQSFSSPYSGVIAKFCCAMLEDKRPIIFGDGLQCRDFVFVSDVVRALIAAAELPASRVAGKSFNVGTGRSTTLLEMIGALNELLQRDIIPEMHPARHGDIKVSKANVTLAAAVLGFRSQITLKDGLKRTLDFYRDQQS